MCTYLPCQYLPKTTKCMLLGFVHVASMIIIIYSITFYSQQNLSLLWPLCEPSVLTLFSCGRVRGRMDMFHAHNGGDEDKWTTFTCSEGQVKKRQWWVDYNMQTMKKNIILVPLWMCLASPTCHVYNNATHLVTPTSCIHLVLVLLSSSSSKASSCHRQHRMFVIHGRLSLCLSGLLLSAVPSFLWP